MKLIQKTFNGDYIVFEDEDLKNNGGCFEMLKAYVIGSIIMIIVLAGGIFLLNMFCEFLFWLGFPGS